jgi:small nuclear ribonucleoprotein (snRNP)-like protein
MESARQLLGSMIRVRISDGRIIEGELQCLDRDLNLVLGSAVEYHGMIKLVQNKTYLI